VAGRAVSTTTGQICSWSREAEELLGYSAAEAVVGNPSKSLSRISLGNGTARGSADLCKPGSAACLRVAAEKLFAGRKSGPKGGQRLIGVPQLDRR
jgi:hypothetical protein